MIPVRLTVRDFLSYADPAPIDFSGFEVACLSGENGAGKSAILDAMTWALFGAARGCEGGQNQDRLIRDGCDETLVDFEFGLNDSTYRVVRRRGRSGRSELRFLVGSADVWTNLAAETLRETDAAISALLRMDYKTFTASAFFVQGRAEDFLARMRPEERKEVFARLLDLGTYERLEEAARGKAREAQARRGEHARIAETLEQSLCEAGAVEDALETARNEAEAARGAADTSVRDVESKRRVLGELEKVEARADAERNAMKEMERGLSQLQKSLAGRTKELREIEKLLARDDEVRAALADSQALAEQERHAREAQHAAFALDKQRTALIERIEAERKMIDARVNETRGAIASAKKELVDLDGRAKELQRIDRALSDGRDPGPAIEEMRLTIEEQRAAEARFGEQLATLDTTEADLIEREAMLARGEGDCPLCGGALDASHLERVKADLRKQLTGVDKQRARARASRDTARKEAERCAEELKRLDRAARERQQMTATRDALLARLERLPKLTDDVAILERSLTADQQLLAGDSFAADLRAEAARLDTQIAETYDTGAHEALRKRIASLEPYASLAGRIAEASKRRVTLERELEELTSQSAHALASFEERKSAHSGLAAQLEGLGRARTELDEAIRRLETEQRRASTAESNVARLSERLAAARKLAEERSVAVKAEKEAAAEHRRYQRLVQAFGRGGIPDLIIDNARPGLEDDANAILGRLSDYEMSVRFEMQREMKSGKAKETFDVLVSHDGGVRDYAMFSGGEAFRIAFAVRLALSKLLTNRAGARLETLVIDEGFGTQDPEGRERLVEAVGLARSEFSKILVITHLDDLKDLFGAQIHVSKDAERGSVVRVVDS
jgi:exonuclease SbcC